MFFQHESLTYDRLLGFNTSLLVISTPINMCEKIIIAILLIAIITTTHYEHFSLLLFITKGWLSALICTKALMDNNRDYEFAVQTKVGYIQQFYWVCYSTGTVYAFIV